MMASGRFLALAVAANRSLKSLSWETYFVTRYPRAELPEKR